MKAGKGRPTRNPSYRKKTPIWPLAHPPQTTPDLTVYLLVIPVLTDNRENPTPIIEATGDLSLSINPDE